MKTAKLTVILSMAFVGPLAFVLGLSDAGNALIRAYGVPGCAAFAIGISLFSAYLIVRFFDELGVYH